MKAYTRDTVKLQKPIKVKMHYTTMADEGTHLIGHTVIFDLTSHESLAEYWQSVVDAQGTLIEENYVEILIPLQSIIGIKVIR